MTADLDILIPHHRDPAGLAASLDSVARQTWPGRLRVVIVDDGSPGDEADDARSRAEAFRVASGHDVLFLLNDRNLGRPRTRNRLLDQVTAAHVAWLDAGDLWYPDKLARQFDHLAHLRAEGRDLSAIWITCAYDWTQGDHTRTIPQHVDGDQLRELLLGRRLRAYLWTLLGTAESFRHAGRFDEGLPRLQDLDLFLAFIEAGGRLETPPGAEPLCRYFKSHLGRDPAEIHACSRRILARHAPALRRYPPAFATELRFRSHHLAAQVARGSHRPALAALHLLRGALENPGHAVRAALRLVGRRLGAFRP